MPARKRQTAAQDGASTAPGPVEPTVDLLGDDPADASGTPPGTPPGDSAEGAGVVEAAQEGGDPRRVVLRYYEPCVITIGARRTLVEIERGDHAWGGAWLSTDPLSEARLELISAAPGSKPDRRIAAQPLASVRIRRGEFCLSSPDGEPMDVVLKLSHRAAKPTRGA